jgi:hypothetical protein
MRHTLIFSEISAAITNETSADFAGFSEHAATSKRRVTP